MLVLAMVISLGSTIMLVGRLNSYFSPTGLITSSNAGNVSLTVQSVTSISLVTSTIAFGSGYANASSGSNCTINTVDGGVESSSSSCINFNALSANSGFKIRNDGNNGVSLNVSVDSNATNLIGGSSPLLQFKFSESEAGSCTGGDNYTGSWQNITKGAHYRLCPAGNFSYVDTADLLYLNIRVLIPTDATAGGEKTANFTFLADDTN